MKTALLRAQNSFMMRRAGVKTEKGDHLLEVLGTIIIAVVVLTLFRGTVLNIFTSALGRTTTSVNELFGNVEVTAP